MRGGLFLHRGERVGCYVVDGLLGIGSNSAVWRVQHAQHGTTHALKLFHPRDDAPALHVRLEALAKASPTHDHLVGIREVLFHQGLCALVLEWVDGPTLEQHAAEHTLAANEIEGLTLGILRGLSALHAHGLAHGDLTLANILLVAGPAGWIPKLTDYGLSAGRLAPGGRDDRFSLGCVLHRLSAGGVGLPPQMREIVARCLRPEPEQRPSCDTLLTLCNGQRAVPDIPPMLAARALCPGKEATGKSPVRSRPTGSTLLLGIIAISLILSILCALWSALSSVKHAGLLAIHP